MRKTRAGVTTSSETSLNQNESSSGEKSGSTSNPSTAAANFPLLEARIKHGRYEDTPINLVKDRRFHASDVVANNFNTCQENLMFSNEINKQRILSIYPSIDGVNNAISSFKDAESLDTDGVRKRPSTFDDKGNMSDSIESDSKHPKSSNKIDEPPGLVPNQVVTAAVGGMLAKQLESPLKSSYNNNSCTGKNYLGNESFSSGGLNPSARSLPPLILASSSSSLHSPSPSLDSENVHSNLVLYTRSHNKIKDSPNNFGSDSSDLGTNSTMVVSKLVKNVNAGLEDNIQSSSSSNYVVISDPESRHMESVGKL